MNFNDLKYYYNYVYYGNGSYGHMLKNEDIEMIFKDSFVVIGKLGSTKQGEGFIKDLWDDANEHFNEIAHLVKRDSEGNPVGFWGAMSDMQMQFLPWTNNFTEGLYLAGAECNDDAIAPEGWTKWQIPAFLYLVIENKNGYLFLDGLDYIKRNNHKLAGAVHDFTDPKTGKNYLYFPIVRDLDVNNNKTLSFDDLDNIAGGNNDK